MALAFVGAVSANSPGGGGNVTLDLTALTGGLASSPSENDLIVIAACQASTSDFDVAMTTSGYTEEVELYANDNRDCNFAVFTKFMGAIPDTSAVVAAPPSGTDGHAAVAHVWRGVDTSTYLDVALTSTTGTNTAAADGPSITPTTSGAVVLVCAGAAHNSTNMVHTHGSLSNLVSQTGDGTLDSIATIGSFAWTSGAYDPAAFGLSSGDSANNSWAAACVALRPAAAAGLSIPIAAYHYNHHLGH